MIAEVLSGGVGEHHLRMLAEALGRALHARMVIIGQTRRATTGDHGVALYDSGHMRETKTYALQNTPCATVMTGGLCLYKSRVRQQFPLDAALQEIGAESYAGMPLIDSLGRSVGLLSVLFLKPIRNEERVRTLLRIFGARASLELERNLMDRQMFRQITAGL